MHCVDVVVQTKLGGFGQSHENRLVRTSKLCPDDRSEHLHDFFRDHLERQVHNKMNITRALYVDDVGKFSTGFVLTFVRPDPWLQPEEGVAQRGRFSTRKWQVSAFDCRAIAIRRTL